MVTMMLRKHLCLRLAVRLARPLERDPHWGIGQWQHCALQIRLPERQAGSRYLERHSKRCCVLTRRRGFDAGPVEDV
jgi:hypothetical protein